MTRLAEGVSAITWTKLVFQFPLFGSSTVYAIILSVNFMLSVHSHEVESVKDTLCIDGGHSHHQFGVNLVGFHDKKQCIFFYFGLTVEQT